VHPAYVEGIPQNDVAVVRLTVPSRYALTKLATGPSTLSGVAAAASGYGYTGELDTEGVPLSAGFPATLQTVAIPLVDPSLCVRMWGKSFNTTQHICAGAWTGVVDTCVGDSGGPLTITDASGKPAALVGVVSFGYGCAKNGAYAVYTRVSSFATWIRSVAANVPAYTPITAATLPAAGASVCSHSLLNSTAPSIVVSCGANKIDSVQLQTYSTATYPCGAPGVLCCAYGGATSSCCVA